MIIDLESQLDTAFASETGVVCSRAAAPYNSFEQFIYVLSVLVASVHIVDAMHFNEHDDEWI